MFQVTVVEIPETPRGENAPEPIERYKATLDTIDLRAVINAVMQKPRKPRTPKVTT